MSKNFRIIYLYIVSLISLGMIVGGFVGTATNIAELCVPQTSYYYYYDKTESRPIDRGRYMDEYEDWLQNEKESVRRRALKDLFSCLALLVVAIPLYIHHYNQTKKLDEKEEE